MDKISVGKCVWWYRGNTNHQQIHSATKIKKDKQKGRDKEKAVDVVVLWLSISHIQSPWQSLGTVVANPPLGASDGPWTADRSVTRDYCPVCLFGLRL